MVAVSHMPSLGGTGSACETGCGSDVRIVTYTASGSEGAAFDVPIGATLALDTYNVGFFAINGSATSPQPNFPTGGSNRTTTTFRVEVPVAPTAGDVWQFLIVE